MQPILDCPVVRSVLKQTAWICDAVLMRGTDLLALSLKECERIRADWLAMVFQELMTSKLVKARAGLDLRAIRHSETRCGSRRSCAVREVSNWVFNRRVT